MTTTTDDDGAQERPAVPAPLSWDEIKVLLALPEIVAAPPSKRDRLIRTVCGMNVSRFWQITVRLAENPPPRLRQPQVKALREIAVVLEAARYARGSSTKDV